MSNAVNVMQTAVATAILLLLSAALADEPPGRASWVIQRASTADYRFAVQSESDGDDRYAALAIRVLDRRNARVVQEIRDIDAAGAPVKPDELLRVVDANFDGWPDISVLHDEGGAGPNVSYNFYLYDPARRRFALNEELSALPQISFHRDKSITSESRESCCSYHAETHRFIQGKLTLVSEQDRALSPDGLWFETTTRNLIDGHWRRKTTRVPAGKERN